MNRLITITLAVALCFAFSPLIAQTSITFTFANGQITGTSPQYYEFDVMAQAGTTGTRIGDNLVYINYNTLAFGPNIQANGKVTVTQGTLLPPDTGPPFFFELYIIVNIADNISSRLAITTEFQQPGTPSSGTLLPTTPTQLLHISIEIADPGQSTGLSFEQSLMANQQYQSDNSTNYSPVIATDVDDTPLPVELTGFSAEALNGKVKVNWSTESEVNNMGFEVYRAPEEEAEYTLLSGYQTNPDLIGQGNSNTRHEYSYTDKSVEPQTTYWYKIADVDLNGIKTFHGPISVTVSESAIPTAFRLHPNYPNPFNPTTTLLFDIPGTGSELVDTKLIIYNSLGQVTRTIYQDKLGPGSYEFKWDGTTDLGNSAPSGIYFAVFRADRFSQARKLILLK